MRVQVLGSPGMVSRSLLEPPLPLPPLLLRCTSCLRTLVQHGWQLAAPALQPCGPAQGPWAQRCVELTPLACQLAGSCRVLGAEVHVMETRAAGASLSVVFNFL